jgi:hypothetical protein
MPDLRHLSGAAVADRTGNSEAPQNGPLRLPCSTAIVIARDDLSMDHCLGSGPLPWCMGDVVCPQGIRLLRLSWPVGTHPTGGAAQRIVTSSWVPIAQLVAFDETRTEKESPCRPHRQQQTTR